MQEGGPFYIKPVLILMICLLLTLLAFGLGRLSATINSQEPVVIEYQYPENELTPEDLQHRISDSDGQVVGSVNSDVYHLPWCSGAQRISAENLKIFNTIGDAEKAGYQPAQNCPGLN